MNKGLVYLKVRGLYIGSIMTEQFIPNDDNDEYEKYKNDIEEYAKYNDDNDKYDKYFEVTPNTYLLYEEIREDCLNTLELLKDKEFKEYIISSLRKTSFRKYVRWLKQMIKYKGLSEDSPINKLDYDLTEFMGYLGYKAGLVLSQKHPKGFLDLMVFFKSGEDKYIPLYNIVNTIKIYKMIRYWKKNKRRLNGRRV